MTLAQQSAVSDDTAFQGRVRMSVFRAAASIVGEDPGVTGFSQTKTDKRHQLGLEVLADNAKRMTAFYKAIAAAEGDVADQSTIVDGTIDTAVDAAWDDIAGVKFGE